MHAFKTAQGACVPLSRIGNLASLKCGVVCVCVCSQTGLYPKVVYVLYEVIGLLNSSNAKAETLEYYFSASSATSLLSALSSALVLTFTKDTLSIRKKHPEALT